MSGSFVPQPGWQRQFEFGWAWGCSSSWSCCAAHLLLCPTAMAVLLCCHPSPAAVAPMGAECCCHAALVLLVCCRGAVAVVKGTWGAEQGHPQSQQPLLGLVPELQTLYSTQSKSKGVAYGARPICLFPFPPVTGGQDGGCHSIL